MAAPTPAPDCVLQPFTGNSPERISAYRGQVLYVDFWASWCPPCAKSFPFLNTMYRDYRPRGLQILAVNLDENSADASKFLGQHPADFIVARSEHEQCARDYRLLGMPSSFLIDRRGNLRHVEVGFHEDREPALRAMVENLLKE